mmetsp:Transcript_158914/g.509710  ORF Transcript_158914/g.509710 Transcript_158914/m.509710 type:complete len:230 (-) Transcript_158914:369-1058(-)
MSYRPSEALVSIALPYSYTAHLERPLLCAVRTRCHSIEKHPAASAAGGAKTSRAVRPLSLLIGCRCNQSTGDLVPAPDSPAAAPRSPRSTCRRSSPILQLSKCAIRTRSSPRGKGKPHQMYRRDSRRYQARPSTQERRAACSILDCRSTPLEDASELAFARTSAGRLQRLRHLEDCSPTSPVSFLFFSHQLCWGSCQHPVSLPVLLHCRFGRESALRKTREPAHLHPAL